MLSIVGKHLSGAMLVSPVSGPFSDPLLPNRIAQFVQRYDDTIGAALGAILGAVISFLLLYFYDQRRFRPRITIKQASGKIHPFYNYGSLMQLTITTTVDALNSGGGVVSILRPTLGYFVGGKAVLETQDLNWLEAGEIESPTIFGSRREYVKLAGIPLLSHAMSAFTLQTVISKTGVSEQAWIEIVNRAGEWQLQCPLSNGRSLRVSLALKGDYHATAPPN